MKQKLILDTTNLTESDNVGAYLRDASGNLLTSTLLGGKQALDVNVISGSDDGVFAEDSAHSSADVGQYILSVRQDTLASSTSADGDYQSIKTDALGRLRTNDASQSGAYSAVSVANTATDLIVTDLANRTRVLIYNNSNRVVYVGFDASVTTSTGMPIQPGASEPLEVTAAVDLHGITSSGTADVRVWELV